MALPPDDKKNSADKPADVAPEGRTTPPPLDKSPAYSEARKAAIAQATVRQGQVKTRPTGAASTAAESQPPTIKTGAAQTTPIPPKADTAQTQLRRPLDRATALKNRGEYPERKSPTINTRVEAQKPAGESSLRTRVDVPDTRVGAITPKTTLPGKPGVNVARTSSTETNLTRTTANDAGTDAEKTDTSITRTAGVGAGTTRTDTRTSTSRTTVTEAKTTAASNTEANTRTDTRTDISRAVDAGAKTTLTNDARAAAARTDTQTTVTRTTGTETTGTETLVTRADGSQSRNDRVVTDGRQTRGRPVRRPAGPGDNRAGQARGAAVQRRKMGPPPASSRKGSIVRRGKPAAYHTINPAGTHEGGAWGPLLIGLLLLAGVAWYAVKHYTPQIETDLARRSNDALANEGLADNATVTIDGRTAILNGTVADRDEYKLAEQSVADTFGVRAVDNQLGIGSGEEVAIEARNQPSFSVFKQDGSVKLTGTVSDSRYATGLEEAAAAHFGADRVDANITIDGNSTNPGWLGAVSQLLPEMDAIDDGSITIENNLLTLTGASDAETKDKIGNLATELTAGQLQVDNQIDAPEPVVPEPVTPEPVVEAEVATAETEEQSPTEQSPAEQEQTPAEPTVAEQSAEQPATEAEPVAEQPVVTEESVADAPVSTEAPVVAETSVTAEAPTAETAPAAESPVAEEPVKEETVAEPETPKLPAFATIKATDDGVTVNGFMSAEGADQILSALGDDNTVVNNINIDDRAETPAWAPMIGDSLAALDGVKNPSVTFTRAGSVKLRGVVDSADAKTATELKVNQTFGDDVSVLNDIEVVIPPPVPTLAPFASIVAVDNTVTITGLLPPASAKAISSGYRASGKNVIENVTRDNRVIEPEWTTAFQGAINGMQDVQNQKVMVNSNGDVTLLGIVEDEAAKEAAGDAVSELFGNSVSLSNDIQVTPTIVPADELQKLFSSIDLAGIRFASNSTELSDSSMSILNQIIDAMQQVPGVNVEISGHTDSAGSYDYNLTLSAQRAEAVSNYLITEGIDSDRLQSRGFGPSRPIASNETRAGRALNRRIEFNISGE